MVPSFFFFNLFLSLVNSFRPNSTSQNPFLFRELLSTPFLLPIRMPSHRGTLHKQSTVPGCQQTWGQPVLPAPAETHVEAAVTASPISLPWRGRAWQGSIQHTSCSCWDTLTGAAWHLKAQNELNRREVCCLQRSPGKVSQRITGTPQTTLQSLSSLQILL